MAVSVNDWVHKVAELERVKTNLELTKHQLECRTQEVKFFTVLCVVLIATNIFAGVIAWLK